MPTLAIPSIEIKPLMVGNSARDVQMQIRIAPQHAPLSFARRESIDRHTNRNTLATSFANRLVDQPSRATEICIEKSRVDVSIKIRREHTACSGDSIGKIRTRVTWIRRERNAHRRRRRGVVAEQFFLLDQREDCS